MQLCGYQETICEVSVANCVRLAGPGHCLPATNGTHANQFANVNFTVFEITYKVFLQYMKLLINLSDAKVSDGDKERKI